MPLVHDYYDRLADSPAEKLLFEGWNFAVQNDLLARPHWFELSKELSCIVVSEVEEGKPREPVGIVCYEPLPGRFWRVVFMYVEPSSEGQGAARELIRRLREKAKSQGVTSLGGVTSVGAARMIDILEYEGAKKIAYTWTLDLTR